MIEHKMRKGTLAILLGLFIVVVALYIDQIRGDTSGTIGLYQIVGAFIGYILAGIGVVLVMKETELSKTIHKILFYGGALIVVISAFPDSLGIPGAPGFDKFQTAGTIAGLLLIVASFFILSKKLFR